MEFLTLVVAASLVAASPVPSRTYIAKEDGRKATHVPEGVSALGPTVAGIPPSAVAAASTPAYTTISAQADTTISVPADTTTSTPADTTMSAPADTTTSAPADNITSAPAVAEASKPAVTTASNPAFPKEYIPKACLGVRYRPGPVPGQKIPFCVVAQRMMDRASMG